MRPGQPCGTALIPLGFGTLATWLLAGPFSGFLAKTLPFHEIEALPTGEILLEVIKAPATWLAVGVVVLGFGGLVVAGKDPADHRDVERDWLDCRAQFWL